MTSTSTRPGRAPNHSLRGASRAAGSQALRAAGQELLMAAGNQVLRAAVDRAVNRVDRVAGRLDAVAEGRTGGSRPPAPTRKPPKPSISGPVRQVAHTAQAGVGAGFSLVMNQAIRLLQLIQRLARQLLAALARVLGRRGSADVATTTGAPEASERTSPPKGGANGRANPAKPRPSAGEAEAPRAPRRPRPRPPVTTEPPVPHRRVAGARPARTGRRD